MAARSPISSVQDFLQVLEQSGLATPELLERLRQRSDAPGDARTVARELVQAGVLTRWQAAQLLHGFYALSIGKYRLLDQLDSGPWGRAYLAEHLPMGRRHVLRVLSREWAGQRQRVQQFLEAARRASQLDHPHLCHVYDVSQEGDRPYVVLEYVEGATLRRRVEESGPLKPAEAVGVAVQVAAGLAHAHERGVFHPGLDASQVVGDAAGVVKVVGLGDLRAQGDERPVGQAPSAADDMYALGSMLVFLLTGRVAADAEQAGRGLGERSGLPDELVALCRKLMAAAPADRPASMAAVRAELEELAGKLVRPDGAATSEAAAVVALTDQAGSAAASATLEDLQKLPVAKPLPVEDGIPVLVGTKPTRADDEVPVVAVSGASKGAKKGTAKAADRAAAPAPERAASEESRPAATPAGPAGNVWLSRKVLLVGGVATAAVVLVAAGGLGYWLLAGRQRTVVAQAPPAAKSKGPAATLPTQEESNPLVAAETNPSLPESTASQGTSPAPSAAAASSSDPGQSSPAPSAAAAASASPDKPSPAPPTAAGAARPAEPATAATLSSLPKEGSKPDASASASPAPGASAATASAPPDAATPPSESSAPPAQPEQTTKAAADAPAKPAPPPPAAKPAPKAVAKPAPKPRPFDGLPTAIDLPQAPEMDGSAEGNSPAVLGPCRVDERATLLITLAGGAAATRNPKQAFELQPQASSARHWDLLLTGESPQKLATLAVEKGQLTFAWQPDLGMLAATARLLSNCAMILQTGDSQHVLALRKPVLGEPLRIDLDKPASVRWTIPDLPLARQLQFAVTRVEGVKDIRKEPSEPVTPGSPLAVWLGPSEKWFPLGLRLNSSANNRGVTVSFQPQIKLQGFSEPRPYRRKEIPAMQQQAAAELDAATKGLEQAKRDRPSTNPVKGAIERELIEKRKTLFTEQLNNLTIVIEQLAYIAQFMETTQGEAKVHFRISYLADDVPIDLLITEEKPPPTAGKK